VVVEDLILGRRQKALDDLRDFVIVRGDGSPVFHLANVVDDATMGITHVLRGNDHLENTFRHLFLYKAIGHEPPAFGHFPMIVNEQGKPYSKRDGDAYVGDFREAGILPEALFNFLALCGWSPGDDREKMSRREMAAAFRLEQVNDAPAQFNREKLEWLNARYLLEASDEELRPHYETAIRGAGGEPEGYEDAWWSRLIAAHRERLKTLAEIAPKTLFFFSDTVSIDWENKKVRKVFKKPEARAVLADLRQRLADLEMAWTEEAIEAAVAACAEERGLKMGAVAQPLRVAATGGTASPGIGETLFLIGRERTLKRLDRALAELPAAEESSP
jgi:glutamyl-tRNA synthetase